MVAGQTTDLPIRIRNTSAINYTTSTYRVGYRWFDAKGNVTGTPQTVVLPATINAGTAQTTSMRLPVTAPPTTGQYTLRLDLVRWDSTPGTALWASDWALPEKYNARNKKALTTDNTRWTGTSAIERDEFSLNVVSGGTSGEPRSIETGNGGDLGINLASRDLSYADDTGIGFADLISPSLTYGHHGADVANCTAYQGILGACGWYTNWDERITGGPNQTGYDYTYQAPTGERYMLDTDGHGQLVGGAPVLINRQRYTYVDENDAPSASVERTSAQAFAGSYSVRALSNAHAGPGFGDKVNLNAYRYARFALRTDSAASAGLCFKIHNVSDSATYPDRWFCYALGSGWNTGFPELDVSGTIAGTWKYVSDDLYTRVSNDGNFGGGKDDYQVIGVQIQSASTGYSGYTYLDALRLEAVESAILDETNRTWSTNAGLVSSWSPPAGAHLPQGGVAGKVTSAEIAASPDCNTSLTSG